MRGDFSRIRFNPKKQYTAVLEQQGRVALDADANEQAAIYNYLGRKETIDVIGQYGAPIDDAGFGITIDQNEIFIAAGRYYVEGLMCENAASLSYDSQPYLIDPHATGAELLNELAQNGGKAVIQVFLEVWQRLVTALDDPCLREPALGQADTTDRLQTVWRVIAVLRPIPAPNPKQKQPDCCTEMYSEATGALPPGTGKMSARTTGATGDCGCEPIPNAGYRGLENQLYRVEIHDSGDESTATFKWSRENGSIVAAIQSLSGATIWVDSLGPDANLGFQANQWVELTDDTYLFGQVPNRHGSLYQIQSIDPAHRSITMTTPVLPVDPSRNARARRWDQTGASAGSSSVPLSVAPWISLENGIQVRFNSGTYKSGEYWTIPARTATGQIEWPPCGSDGAAFQLPHFIRVYVAPLACIHWNPSRRPALFPQDCRRLFSPLTDLAASSTAQAMHVTNISWSNDDVTTLDQLVANGLTITLDQAPSSPINGANFIVTFEPALPPASNSSTVLGITRTSTEGLPSTILRGVTIVDAEIVVTNTTLSWQLPFLKANPAQRITILFLDQLLSFGAPAGWFARARVRLLGRAIFSGSSVSTGRSAFVGAPAFFAGETFLDGQSFGQAALRADGATPRIDLQLPSGNSDKASDFEGWFYVAPTLLLVSVAINFAALTVVVNANNQVTSVTALDAAGKPEKVTPQVTVTVSYPAIADTTVDLALAGTTGVGSVASIPSTCTVKRNQATTTFDISILSNPGANTTLTFTITASLNSALGPVGALNASFTVTGVPPPTNILFPFVPNEAL